MMKKQNDHTPILSDVEVFNLIALDNNLFCADSNGEVTHQASGADVDWFELLDMVRRAEQALIAKQREQKPIAWVDKPSMENAFFTQCGFYLSAYPGKEKLLEEHEYAEPKNGGTDDHSAPKGGDIEQARAEFETLMRSEEYLFDKPHQLERDPSCGTYTNTVVRGYWKLWKTAKGIKEMS